MEAEEEMALPERDARHLRHAATQRSIRYWNAYVKSGSVRKTHHAGAERAGRRRWRWGDEGRKAPQNALDQPFDGDMVADDHVSYSLNKKQRWRLMDAFEETLEDDDDDDDEDVDEMPRNEDHPRDASNFDVTVALTDIIQFKADCRRILQKPANSAAAPSTSATPQIRDSLPTGRYSQLQNVLRGFVSDRGDRPRDDGRERRRARGQRDQGRLVTRPTKIPGHSRRCNCGRCATQSETTEWRSTAQLAEVGRGEEEREPPADEIRYVVEAPVQKRLVTKRAIICDNYNKAHDKIVKGKKAGKSATEMADELDEDFEAWSEEEEEEEEKEEKEEESEAKGYKLEGSSLAEWMTPKRIERKSARGSCVGAFKKVGANLDAEKKEEKSHIRYLEHGEFVSLVDDFVVVASPNSSAGADAKEEEEEELTRPMTRVAFPTASAEATYLRTVFDESSAISYFEADSFPRAFAVDVSEAVTERLEAERKKSMENAFGSEDGGRTPIPIEATEAEKGKENAKPLTKKQSKAAAKRAKRGSKRTNYYVPSPDPSSRRSDVKCFLVFKEEVGGKRDYEQIFEVSLNSDIECASGFPAIRENDADGDIFNRDILDSFSNVEKFVVDVVEAVTRLPRTVDRKGSSTNDRSNTYGRGKSNIRVSKGMYQSAAFLDRVAPAVDRLSPKDLDVKIKKNISKANAEASTATMEADGCASLLQESYCNICWMPIGLIANEDATALGACASEGHWFCDACWRSHLLQQVANGASALTCPEFDCSVNADFATMLRLLPWKRCNVFLRRLEDRMIVDGANSKWCPAPGCGCALVVDADILAVSGPNECLPVSCSCGLILCFRCLGEQHWPATCEESGKFREARVKNGHEIPMFDGSYLGDIAETYVAKVKQCPHCKRKMEKGEGCDHMSCSCGKSYCWRCGKDFYTGHYGQNDRGEEIWVGCKTDQELEKIALEEVTAGSAEWYAKAMFYRRYRRTNAWSNFNLKKFLKLHYIRKVRYEKTEDIVRQYETLIESRRNLHQLVRHAFGKVVETLQVLEYLTVANHFRRRRNKSGNVDDNNNNNNNNNNRLNPQQYLTNHIWFFVSRLVAILSDGPKSTEAPKVEADIKENLKEIKDGVSTIRTQLE